MLSGQDRVKFELLYCTVYSVPVLCSRKLYGQGQEGQSWPRFVLENCFKKLSGLNIKIISGLKKVLYVLYKESCLPEGGGGGGVGDGGGDLPGAGTTTLNL